MPDVALTAIVLAAGSSRRLGQPKQLLPYRGATLLDATLANIRSFGFEQPILALGGAAAEVRDIVDLRGFRVVDSVHHTEGCSSSIVSSLAAIDPKAPGFMLFLGDQPDVPKVAVEALRSVADDGAEIGVVDYVDGTGHPFYFARSTFPALSTLHGDKAVWKLLESGRFETAHVRVEENVPLDVDTWDEYERLLEADVH